MACWEHGPPHGRLLQGTGSEKWCGQICEQVNPDQEVQDTYYYSMEVNPANSERKRSL